MIRGRLPLQRARMASDKVSSACASPQSRSARRFADNPDGLETAAHTRPLRSFIATIEPGERRQIGADFFLLIHRFLSRRSATTKLHIRRASSTWVKRSSPAADWWRRAEAAECRDASARRLRSESADAW